MKTEVKNTYPDYKKIREEANRIDHTITLADFDTRHPSLNRIAYMISDVNRYLKNKNGGRI